MTPEEKARLKAMLDLMAGGGSGQLMPVPSQIIDPLVGTAQLPLSPGNGSTPQMPQLVPMQQAQQTQAKNNPQWPPPLAQIPQGSGVVSYPQQKMQDQVPVASQTPQPPFRNGVAMNGIMEPGRIPGVMPTDRLFPETPELAGPEDRGVYPEDSQVARGPMPAPSPVPQPGASYNPYSMPETPVAPSQQDNRLANFLQALGSVQAPPAPEAVRVATPPPPARPQSEVGDLLKLLLASGGGQAPMLSQILGRG
jgi:hypothetical protein